MMTTATSISRALRNSVIVLAQFMFVSVFIISLTGCGADGGSGPVISSTSSPTTEENPEVSTDPTGGEVEDLGPTADLPEGEEDPTNPGTPEPTGATARLTWDASANPDITNYYVYYSKQSSGQPGSCSYEASQSVEAPPATITGLEPNTAYFFAVSSFADSESMCSNEMLVVTPPAQG